MKVSEQAKRFVKSKSNNRTRNIISQELQTLLNKGGIVNAEKMFNSVVKKASRVS